MKLCLPLLSIVLLRMRLIKNATAIPKKYIDRTTIVLELTKNAPQIVEYNGSFALQDRYGVKIAVFILLFLSSKFLLVNDAVVAQPKLISKVNTLLPLNPSLEKKSSKVKASLDIYPVCSKISKNINKSTTCGKKFITETTPPIKASLTKDKINSLSVILLTKLYKGLEKQFSVNSANLSVKKAPMLEKVKKKINAKIDIKIGIAKYLFNKILSNFDFP